MDELEAADRRLQKYRKFPNQRIGEIRDEQRSRQIDNDVRITEQLADFLVRANTDLQSCPVTGRKKGTNGKRSYPRIKRYEALPFGS